jgi:AbrB family looped-hinge helix DNA binding protein
MHEEAKITSKGQITVPKRIRTRLGVKEGDLLAFDDDGDKVVVRPVRKVSPFEKYRGIGNKGIGLGREAVIRYVRDMRGFDPDEE